MPTIEEIKKTEWYKERPKVIKDLISKFPYAATVKLKSTSQIGYVYSWFEDGTISVIITEEDNPKIINALPGTYKVFGCKADEVDFIKENPSLWLESCEDADPVGFQNQTIIWCTLICKQ